MFVEMRQTQSSIVSNLMSQYHPITIRKLLQLWIWGFRDIYSYFFHHILF